MPPTLLPPPLGGLAALRELDLSYTRALVLRPLQGAKHLTRLRLANMKLELETAPGAGDNPELAAMLEDEVRRLRAALPALVIER